jgi:hypothetical protein
VSQVKLIAGGAMLLFGASNLLLGSVVAVKLKKLRKSLPNPAALSAAYLNAVSSGPEAEQGLDGLNAAGSTRLFEALGAKFSKIELQAVFLEIDGERKGLLTEDQLITWYHHPHPTPTPSHLLTEHQLIILAPPPSSNPNPFPLAH